MNLPLISFDEYKKSVAGKNLFNGHFWTTGGDLFEVKTRRITTQSPHPSCRTVGFLKTDTFHVTEKKRITITLKEIGDDDVVYDENGDFVCTRPGHNPERKGEIYIRKKKHTILNPPGLAHKDMKASNYKDVPFKSAEAKTHLTPEAYSKIFTHILSLDKDIEKDLKGLRNGKISVEVEIGGAKSYYNMTEDERYKGRKEPNAFASAKANIVVAKISPRVANADDTYATIWNVLSLLGVHEMKHVTYPWTGDHHETHHLNYIFQKAHHSWKNTTPSFKEQMNSKLKTDYYNKYKGYQDSEKNRLDERYRKYREFGIYPPRKGYFEDIESQLINIVKDDNQLKTLDYYFRKKDEEEDRGDFYKYRER